MRMTREKAAILDHALSHAGGYYCGDSPEMQELVEDGLMRSAGRKSFVPDEYFCITTKGKAALQSYHQGEGRASISEGDNMSDSETIIAEMKQVIAHSEPVWGGDMRCKLCGVRVATDFCLKGCLMAKNYGRKLYDPNRDDSDREAPPDDDRNS